MVELTKDEAESLRDFIECEFLEDIRENTEIDNLVWVANIIHVWEKCRAKMRGEEDG